MGIHLNMERSQMGLDCVGREAQVEWSCHGLRHKQGKLTSPSQVGQ